MFLANFTQQSIIVKRNCCKTFPEHSFISYSNGLAFAYETHFVRVCVCVCGISCTALEHYKIRLKFVGILFSSRVLIIINITDVHVAFLLFHIAFIRVAKQVYSCPDKSNNLLIKLSQNIQHTFKPFIIYPETLQSKVFIHRSLTSTGF